jgi:hypothetical protein
MSRAIPRCRLYHIIETQLQLTRRPGLTESTALHDTGHCNNTAPYLRYLPLWTGGKHKARPLAGFFERSH